MRERRLVAPTWRTTAATVGATVVAGLVAGGILLTVG